MEKQLLKWMLLTMLILAWLLIPRYITGAAGYFALAALSILAILCFYKTRSWQSQRVVSDRSAKHLRNLCLALSIVVIHIYIPIILVALSLGYKANKVMSTIAVGVFILNWYTYPLLSRKKTDNLMNASIYLADGPLCLCFIFLILEDWKGMQPVPWVIAIIGCLAICLGAFMTSQVPRKKIVYDAGWVGCILIAIIATVFLNTQFCGEQHTVKTYYADRSTRIGTSCILSDGYQFNYSGCPTPVGCTGRIKQYDGWFHIRFLSE